MPDQYKSMVAGAVSGVVVRFAISPIDVLKIRLQLERFKRNSQAGALSVLRRILRNEGILAFWKGNLPAEIMYLLYGSVQFGSYTFFKNNAFPGLPEDLKNLISGGIGGSLATIVSYPFDTVRTRLAADPTKGFKNLRSTMKQLAESETYKGFYGGLKPTLYQMFLYTGISFWTYNRIQDLQKRLELDQNSVAIPISGFIAGAFSKAVTYPLDSVKRRLQVQKSGELTQLIGYQHLRQQKDVYETKSIAKICLKIVQTEGVFSLYRGFAMALLKSGPATSLSFSVYEFCMKVL